ncbi:MAG: polysaccharide pyruvyl transferase family protein [Candidatus Eremiobacteraeota bacterium]|nr:polysaccharide pyruvyl transferase family protein [Candidatus Eremiobacteraeota bacterium]
MKDKFLITNSVALNGGDAAILLSMIESIKREFGEDVDIKVQAKKHEACRRYYPEVDFIPALEEREKGRNLFEKIFLRLKYSRLLLYAAMERFLKIRVSLLLTDMEREITGSFRDNNVVISCGGGFLNDYYPLYKRTVGFILARLYGCKTVIYAQSVGPFWRYISKLQARWILENASLVILRDEKSYDILRNRLNIKNENTHITADEAHLLPSVDPGKTPVSSIKKEFPGKLLVGISIRRWEFGDIPDEMERQRKVSLYISAVKEICTHLVDKYNTHIVFISTCQGRPEYFIDDSKFAAGVIKDLPREARDNITVTSDAYDPRKLKKIMENFDLFVGMRMHTIILAMCAGVPCVGLGYEFKTEELFKQVGLPEYAVDLKSDRIERLNDIVDDLIENREIVSKKIKNNLNDVIARAKTNASLLCSNPKNSVT